MSSNFDEKNLIFLISQPRAGSTMLQKILGSHPEIYTVSEPWLLLHPVYALRDSGYEAEYDAKLAKTALDSFLNLFPDQKQVYLETISEVYGKLYQKALDQTDKKYFLDKTPRYYHIIPELAKIFPEAKFIILLRNPLAVLSSIISTWIVPHPDRWFYLENHKDDLFKAPELLLQGINLLQDRCLVVHYEKFLENPDIQTRSICDKLNIPFHQKMLVNDKTNSAQWIFGDKKDPYKTSQPNAKNIVTWQNNINSPQILKSLNDYLDFLGEEILTKMGYSYQELWQSLQTYHSDYRFLSWTTLPLEYIVNKPKTYTSNKYRFYKIKLINKLEKKGILNF